MNYSMKKHKYFTIFDRTIILLESIGNRISNIQNVVNSDGVGFISHPHLS